MIVIRCFHIRGKPLLGLKFLKLRPAKDNNRNSNKNIAGNKKQ